jgi:hypothetical protein
MSVCRYKDDGWLCFVPSTNNLLVRSLIIAFDEIFLLHYLTGHGGRFPGSQNALPLSMPSFLVSDQVVKHAGTAWPFTDAVTI